MENKMKKVEKSFYSLNSVGCKPKLMNPETIAFLYKQFSQSIFRYHLDNIFINEKSLKEFDIRQNILIKRFIGLSKFTKTKPLNKALKLESIRQIYYKHKIFFVKQIFNNQLCKNVLEY